MDSQLDNIIRQVMPKWDDNDYELCQEIKKTMATKGWTVIENLFKDFDAKLRAHFKKVSDDANVNRLYKIAGMMEGVDTLCDLPYRVIREEEEQKKLAERQNASSIDDMLKEAGPHGP